MQATTIETFVVGSALETAVERVLRTMLSKKEMARLGFGRETTLEDRLAAFAPLLPEIRRKAAEIARLTDLETKAYAGGCFSTYFAEEGLITVFIDSTERSPTFRLVRPGHRPRAETEVLDPGLDRGGGPGLGLEGLSRPAVPGTGSALLPETVRRPKSTTLISGTRPSRVSPGRATTRPRFTIFPSAERTSQTGAPKKGDLGDPGPRRPGGRRKARNRESAVFPVRRTAVEGGAAWA